MAAQKSQRDYILVICPVCQARLHPRMDQVGTRIECPDCGRRVTVRPPVAEPVAKLPTPEEIGNYDVGTVAATPRVETQYLAVQAEIYERPLPAPPRWTFFSGVIEFPWRRGTLSRWLLLTVGFWVAGLFLAGILKLTIVSSGTGPGMIAGAALAFLGLPLVWLTLWTLSYAADCYLAIVQETAAGNDTVEWPEVTWRERVLRLVYVGYIAVLAAVAAYAVGLVVELSGGPFGPPFGGVLLVLFPVLLLSSIDMNSPWAVLSPFVLRSLPWLWWGWLLFYADSVLLAAVCVAPLWLGYARHPFLFTWLIGPLWAAAILIHARLLGRVAWRAGTIPALRPPVVEPEPGAEVKN